MFATNSINVKQYRGQGFMTVSRFNNTGEYIFVADKDSKQITLINALTHTIIGSYHGHNGVIWCLDTNQDTSVLISGSGDTTFIIWDVKTGDIYNQIQAQGIPKCVQINNSNNIVVMSSDQVGKKPKSFVLFYNLNSLTNNNEEPVVISSFEEDGAKITSINWLNDVELIISTDTGKIRKYNYMTKEFSKEIHPHALAIKTIKFNKNKEYFLTASSDAKAKIINSDTFDTIKTLKSTHPINCAVFSADNEYVLLGGGHEALVAGNKDANDTRTKIYSAKSGDLFKQLSNHFGPIRYIDFSPNNQAFVTASQDGIAKIHYWGDPIASSDNQIEKFGVYSSDSHEIILTSEQINWEDANSSKDSAKSVENSANTNSSSTNTSNSQNKAKSKPKEHFPVGHENYNKNAEQQEAKAYKVSSSRTQDVQMPTTVRVSNLPVDIDVRDLWETFEFFGRIEERGIKIKSNQDEVFAFINYCDDESAKKAVEKMDKSRIEYCVIHVEIVKPRY
jgi:translation initiation factor 3 subunit I